MGTGAPQSRTKERLIKRALRPVRTKAQRERIREFLAIVPTQWLTPTELTFTAHDDTDELDVEMRAAGIEIMNRIVILCDDLIPSLVDDFLARHGYDLGSADHDEFRRRTGPVVVGDVLTRMYASWPPTAPELIDRATCLAVDRALGDLLNSLRAQPAAGVLLRPDRTPVDDRDQADRHLTRATSDDATHRRYITYEQHRENLFLTRIAVRTATGLIVAVILSVLYVGLVLGLRRFAPDLTVEEDIMIVGAALGASGIGLAGQVLKNRFGGSRRSADPGPAPPSDHRPGPP